MRSTFTAAIAGGLILLISVEAFAQQSRGGRGTRAPDRGAPAETRSAPPPSGPQGGGGYVSDAVRYPGRGSGGGGAPGP